MQKTDYGPGAFAVDVMKAALAGSNFRTALWTGRHLQLTLMTIPAGDDIGVELHPTTDQILLVAQGSGTAQMGYRKEHLTWQQPIFCDSCVFVPAGTWHNIVNTGDKPLKLISVYAPPNHAHGAIHQTKAIAEAEEHNH